MSFVYVILADNGEVKVGFSGTPYARLSKIKKEYGVRRGFSRAELFGFVRTDAFFFVEIAAHSKLEDFAVGGEWYRINPIAAFRVVIEEARFWSGDFAVNSAPNNSFKPKPLRSTKGMAG